jgi:membrane dipeptidase
MKKSQTTWSRREFLNAVAMAGAGTAIVLNPFVACAVDDVDPRVARIVASMISVDTHNHIDVPFTAAEVPGPTANQSRRRL